MPAGDGTGPGGAGPMSGGAAGYCAGYASPGYRNRPLRNGLLRRNPGSNRVAYGSFQPRLGFGARLAFGRGRRVGGGRGRSRW